MKVNRGAALVVIFVGMILSLFLSTSFAANTANLWITDSFNGERILERKVSFEKENVIDLLRQNANIVTAFAGGFVTEINGRVAIDKGGIRKDWLYYVNGIMAHVGGLAYHPGDGDTIWWDYHRWNDALSIPAVIGAYPQPFVNGYEGKVPKTVILSTEALNSSAQALEKSLKVKGVQEVEVVNYTGEISEFNKSLCILLGSWSGIKDDTLIHDMIKNSQQSGFLIKFENDKLIALDVTGASRLSLDKGSAILAAGSGFQAQPPLWIVTGTDDAEVKNAVDILVNQPERIQFHSAAVISNGEIHNVPVFAENK